MEAAFFSAAYRLFERRSERNRDHKELALQLYKAWLF